MSPSSPTSGGNAAARQPLGFREPLGGRRVLNPSRTPRGRFWQRSLPRCWYHEGEGKAGGVFAAEVPARWELGKERAASVGIRAQPKTEGEMPETR